MTDRWLTRWRERTLYYPLLFMTTNQGILTYQMLREWFDVNGGPLVHPYMELT